MSDNAIQDTHTPVHFNEDEARAPVIYRRDTGDTLPNALWIAAGLFRQADELAVQYLQVNLEELAYLAERQAQGLAPINGAWMQGGPYGDLTFWVSTAEVYVLKSLRSVEDDIGLLMSIFTERAPDTPDARAAYAALEAAPLRRWPELPQLPSRSSYLNAKSWLSSTPRDDTDPSFQRFRAEVEYLTNRPVTIAAALEEVESAFG